MDRNTFSRLAPTVVAPVVVVTPKDLQHIGTAFCVSSSGIWITARHIFEGRNSYEDYKGQYPSSRLAILWTGPDDERRTPIFVSGFTRHPASGSDLALLRIDRPEIAFPATRLNAFVPEIDTPICGLGYPSFQDGLPMLKVAPGIVSNIFRNGRDSVSLPTASYETTAAFDPLMSGGPVFQPDGSVCGVIATGMDAGPDGEPAISFASATPYIFMLKVAYSKSNTVSIYDLAKQRTVLTDSSFELLRMTDTDGQLRVFYASE
ncbi:S1 family peptidase [Mycolicibacterium mengxianglii]|uniref:S1 family peptidase n=1 Tax=Mycolicibacterium mengxianglii TaxID=2736649 RepID=UPI001E53B37D|nr:serine protease [Mycolicibacterium mengxianglii]